MILPEYVKVALDRLYGAGYEACVVGGAVRDFLRGVTPCDYDITTPSTPDETKTVFCDFPVFLQGEKHGTVGVIIDGEKLEITTHRCDGEYLDHRRPESVSFSRKLSDDLSRRDFTVNAMAYSLTSGVIDLFCGREDLKNRVVRCVGDAVTRFEEDALRILRAIRFSSTLGFTVEEKTRKAIFEKKELLRTVSGERIREETEKLVLGENALSVISEYAEIFETVFDSLDTSLFDSRFNTFSRDAKLALFYIALRDENKYSRLKFSNEEKSFLKDTEELFFADIPDRFTLKRYIAIYGLRAMSTSLALKGNRDLVSLFDEVVSSGECLFRKDLKITGADLKEMGIPEGREMGRILDTLFDLVLKNEVENEKEELIKIARKH